jgi:micrococcal nuclease
VICKGLNLIIADRKCQLFIGLFFLGVLLIGENTSSAKYQQSIVDTIDGDTVDIKIINSYRLAGIDAPEKDQPQGKESSQRLQEILESGQLVGLWCLPKSDKYGRDICMITLNIDGKKIDPAEELIKEGLAEVEYARFLPPSTESIYKTAQQNAQEKKLGIWGLEKHIKPSDWRKTH